MRGSVGEALEWGAVNRTNRPTCVRETHWLCYGSCRVVLLSSKFHTFLFIIDRSLYTDGVHKSRCFQWRLHLVDTGSFCSRATVRVRVGVFRIGVRVSQSCSLKIPSDKVYADLAAGNDCFHGRTAFFFCCCCFRPVLYVLGCVARRTVFHVFSITIKQQ